MRHPRAMARGGCRRRRATLVLILALAASAVGAWAFWSAHGTGSNSAVSGSLAAAAIAAPGSGINSVTVTWSQQAALAPASSSSSAITYSVERKLAGGSFAAVSTGGCSGAKAQGTTSCLDAPPATGTYSYRAVATYHTWTATSAEAGPVSFLLDTVPPTVVSIGRVGASPTNAGSVSWTVAFSEAVTGVDSGDFVLVHTGSAAGSAVSVSGSGASYTVTSATVTGDGTLGLNLVDDDRIKDLGGNSLGGTGAGNGSLTGQTFTIDHTPPTVASIGRVGPTPTNLGSLSWTVTFSEAVTGVDSGDFVLVHTGSAAGSTVSVSGSGTTYTVTSATVTGDGTLGLNLVDDDTIKDLAGNSLGGAGAGNGSFTGQAYTIDHTAPALVSMSMLDTDHNGKVDQVTATFNETLASSTNTSQWTLANAPSGATLASVSTSATVATLTLNEGAGAANTAVGSFTLALAANAAGIRDLAGNQASFAATAPADAAPPAVVSISPVGASPTNAGSVSWTVTFSEAVTGVDSGDFVLVHTASAAGSAVSVSGSGATYTVTSATVTGDGTLGLNLVDDDTIKDLAGISLGGTGAGNGSLTGQTFTIDHTPPTVASIGLVGVSPTNAASVSWTVTFSEAVTGVDSGDFVLVHTASAAGSTVSVAGSGATYTVTSATVTGDGTLGLNLVDDDTIKDLAGNSLGGSGAGNGSFTGQASTIDHTAPALVSMSMLDTDHNGIVDRVTATFNETLASSTNTSQWTLVSPPGAVTLASVSTSATVATLTLTGGSANTAVGSFTLALAANAAGIRDAAGNQASFAATAPTDDAPPVPVSVTDTSGSFDGLLQAGDTISATFSEPIASGLPSSPAITESRPATGNATLTIPGFALGSLDMMSADYLLLPLTSVTFSGTSALSNANKTITITGSCGLCLNLVNSTGSGTGMVYVPATTLLDSAGNAATGSFTTNFRIF